MNIDELAEDARAVVQSGNEDTSDLHWFVVGGAVRDTLRGEEPSDFDFVVTGEDEQSMLDRGFTLVDNSGTDTFPVFLNSDGEEFALARQEVSSGDGHTDFEVNTEKVSLEQDLKRRDIRYNSMAVSPEGELINPHNGLQDLEDGIIRATNPESFKEDNLRVLRVARFAARTGHEIADETMELMREVDLTALVGERVRMELTKTLKQAEQPRRFFDVLDEANQLEAAFPELAALKGVPAGPEEHHKEKDAFEHTMMVLEEMAALRPGDEIALLMALAHDLGKQKTPIDKWPHHHGHGGAGIPIIEKMNRRLSFSNRQVRAMKDAARHHTRMKHIGEMNAKTVFDLTKEVHFPDRLIDLAVADGRGKEPPTEFPEAVARRRFAAAREARKKLTGADLIEQGISPDEIGGAAFGKRLRDKRISIMKGIESQSV